MELNRFIDHTLLRPDATPDDIIRLCREAVGYDFFAVVVNPIYVHQAANLVKETGVKVCSIAGFPLGASLTEIKIAEAVRAEHDGADEIDLVANIGWIQSGQFGRLAEELTSIKKTLHSETILKIIIETPLTRPENWPHVIEAVVGSGADFVKTATGFFGATPPSHVRQLCEYAGGRIGIKASGRIRTAAHAVEMINAGALRIGTSSAVAIMAEFRNRSEM